MATSPQAATLDRKPGWPTGSGVLRWTSTRLIRQHTNQRTEPSRARTSSDLSGSASAPLLPAIRAPEGAAAGPTLPNGEAVIIPPKTRGPSGRQVRTLGLGLGKGGVGSGSSGLLGSGCRLRRRLRRQGSSANAAHIARVASHLSHPPLSPRGRRSP